MSFRSFGATVFIIFARSVTFVSGKSFAIDFVKVVRFGVTFICFIVNSVSVRFASFCILSVISMISCSLYRARKRCIKVGDEA